MATEPVSLENSVGRTTAYEVESTWTLPAFETSAMDGFAVRSEETLQASEANPLMFEIQGGLAAGDQPSSQISKAHTAWEIMTGAPFPEGFDACIRQEDVTVHAGQIKLTKPVLKNQNRRQAGEDFRVGSMVVDQGHQIRNEDLLCFAALGITEIEVFKKLRVAVIATGKELVDANQMPFGAQIRNSTTPYLLQTLRSRNVETIALGTVGDNSEDYLRLIRETKGVDVILTTGALSVGKYDFVVEALLSIGLEMYFQKVKIRPGKPLLFGKLPNGPFLIGLPGNPIAAATGFRFFVDPLLRALEGFEPERPLQAKLLTATRKAKDTTSFLKAFMTRPNLNTQSNFQSNFYLTVEAHENQKPSMTFSLLKSNAWIMLDETVDEDVAEGTLVDVYPFSPESI